MAPDRSAVLVASPDAPATPAEVVGRRRSRETTWIAPCAIGVIAVVLRLLTAATGPTDWDSAQYALATGRYDVTHGLPQPPGYWLYVESGRALSHFGGLGTVRALVVVAALASGAAAALTVLAGRDLGGAWVGLAAGAVVATSPFAWFSGSVVATYSFDLLACPLLIVLAWRARPGSWHGVAAVAAIGLLAGFRQSIVQSFALLALVPVVASTRTWRLLAATVGAAVVSVGVWFVPMVATQPGGLGAWVHATRIEATGAAQATSVLDHAPGGATNLGTFAGATAVALAPLALLAVLAGAVLFVRAFSGSAGTSASAATIASSGGPVRRRPWYQTRAAVLGAALLPPILLVALVQFAKGGYLLAYLPAAVIAMLVPLGALDRHTAGGRPHRTTSATRLAGRAGLPPLAGRHDGGCGGRRRARRAALPRRRRRVAGELGAEHRRPLVGATEVPGSLCRDTVLRAFGRRGRHCVDRPRSGGGPGA